MYDVIIIGAGVSGTAIARELSRYNIKACVLEKCDDVCQGTSKANSAIVHAGFDAQSGTLMAKLNLEGNKLMGELSKELDFPFVRNGALVICTDKEDMDKLKTLYQRGLDNGVEGLKIINREEVLKMEPNITDNVVAALYAETSGIVDPFLLNIAMAENAYTNGIEFYFNTKVISIDKDTDKYVIHTNKGDYTTKYVVNAAGVYADTIHNMISEEKMSIIPRRGDYCLLDKSTGQYVSRTIFALPGKHGKGVLVSPTIHGNLIVGPTAVDIDDKDGVNTSVEGITELISKAGLNVKNIPMRQVITSFAGLRAHEPGHEFIIKELDKGFIDCAGIESPGLTSSPAIGVMVAELLRDKMQLNNNPHFNGKRQAIIHLNRLSIGERNELIKQEPAYGQIICRCEMITEGEIIDAIRRPLGAKSIDGIKHRVRAGMGRCQGGFCMPRVMEILSRELGVDMEDITKCGGDSRIIVGKNKDVL